jgi:outer membrane immunogenic protein
VGSSSGTQTGWVAGGGIEHSFAPNWSVKLEYQYIDLGSKTLIDPASVITSRNVDGRFSTVRVGLNYKFGGDPWGKAPVVAKY